MPYSISKSPLYGIKSIHRLCTILFLSEQNLKKLTSSDDYYLPFSRTENGKQRHYQPPTGINEVAHRRLFVLLKRISLPSFLHLGPKGKSYLTNAKAHVGGQQRFKVDIKQYFPSTTWYQIYSCFKRDFKCAGDVSGALASLVTYDNHLPTGSPVSTLLAYFVHRKMFETLYSRAQNDGVTMTAFQDDITFSGERIDEAFRKDVRVTVKRSGLTLSRSKERFTHGGQSLSVTGLIVTTRGVHVPKRRHENVKKRMQEFENASSIKELEASYRRLIGSLQELTNVTGKKCTYLWKFKEDFRERRRNLETESRIQRTSGP